MTTTTASRPSLPHQRAVVGEPALGPVVAALAPVGGVGRQVSRDPVQVLLERQRGQDALSDQRFERAVDERLDQPGEVAGRGVVVAAVLRRIGVHHPALHTRPRHPELVREGVDALESDDVHDDVGRVVVADHEREVHEVGQAHGGGEPEALQHAAPAHARARHEAVLLGLIELAACHHAPECGREQNLDGGDRKEAVRRRGRSASCRCRAPWRRTRSSRPS